MSAQPFELRPSHWAKVFVGLLNSISVLCVHLHHFVHFVLFKLKWNLRCLASPLKRTNKWKCWRILLIIPQFLFLMLDLFKQVGFYILHSSNTFPTCLFYLNMTSTFEIFSKLFIKIMFFQACSLFGFVLPFKVLSS